MTVFSSIKEAREAMRGFKKVLDAKKESGAKKKEISAARKLYKNARTQLLALKSAKEAQKAKKTKDAPSLEPSAAAPARRMRTRSMDAADEWAAKRARQSPPKPPSVHRMRTRSMDEAEEPRLTPTEFRKKHQMHITGMHESGALGIEYKVISKLICSLIISSDFLIECCCHSVRTPSCAFRTQFSGLPPSSPSPMLASRLQHQFKHRAGQFVALGVTLFPWPGRVAARLPAS